MQFNLEIISVTWESSIYTMDHSKFILSNQDKESIHKGSIFLEFISKKNLVL